MAVVVPIAALSFPDDDPLDITRSTQFKSARLFRRTSASVDGVYIAMVSENAE